MTGYLLLTKGDASFARSGWFAINLAVGLVEEKHLLATHEVWKIKVNIRPLLTLTQIQEHTFELVPSLLSP